MAIKIGSTKGKLYIGNKKGKKVYLGGIKVYSAGNICTYHVDAGQSYAEEIDESASCLSPKTFTPVKSGWTFVGWREDATANGAVLNGKVMGDNPIALYAVFRQTITVTYYNGSTTASVATGARYYNNGTIANPSFTLSQTALSGWTARGWASGANADAGIVYNNGVSFTRDSNCTLYGCYYQTITLSYSGNGSTGGSTAAQTGTRYWNTGTGKISSPSFTLRANGFTRTNYTFQKWAAGSTGGTQYAAGATITLASNMTMYAMWKPTNISTASIKANYLYGSTHENFTKDIIYAWSSATYELTNVKSITFTLNYYYYDTSEPTEEKKKYFYDAFDYYAGISANKSGFAKYSGIEKIGYEDSTTVKNATTNITLDVSGLSGAYYIGAGTRGMNRFANDILKGSHYERGKKPAYYAMITSVSFS